VDITAQDFHQLVQLNVAMESLFWQLSNAMTLMLVLMMDVTPYV